MWVLVVVVEWWATVVHFWFVIGLRVPVRRPVSVFVPWFIVRLRLVVWFWFMICWSWVVIGVWLSIMFNLIAVMGSLQGDVVSFVLVVVASRRRRWWRRWRRRRWRRRRMVWLNMMLFGIMMTWLVVAITMTMILVD